MTFNHDFRIGGPLCDSPVRRRTCAALTALLLLTATGTFAVNSAPYAESFETYTNNHPISTEDGWSAVDSSAVLVTTNAAIVNAETNYPTGGKSFPLDTTHSNVLQVADSVINAITSTAGNVVFADFMLYPSRRDAEPTASTNQQFGIYFNTSGRAVIWHRNSTGPTNEWLTLTNSPVVSTTAWHRVTVGLDYINDLFQIRIDEDSPLSDALGYASGGGSQPGSWFQMVQTNGALARMSGEGRKTYYIDDLVVSNRALSYSGAIFNEVAANDGAIDNSLTITLSYGTFVGANGSNFVAGGEVVVANVPAGTTAVVTRASDTTLTASLVGNAADHVVSSNVSDLTLTFQDSAFELGQATSVEGRVKSDLQVAYIDPTALSYSSVQFIEGTAGAIGNSVGVTLVNDTFVTGSISSPTHFTATGVPAGLGVQMVRDTDTTLTMSLTNAANDHAAADTTNVGLTFTDAAFENVAVSLVVGTPTNIAVTFLDAPALSYSTTVFSEGVANDGSVQGGSITLAADLFDGTAAEDFVASGKVQTNNVPAGLTVSLTMNAGSNLLTVAFAANATSHLDANDVSDLTFNFQDSAFANTAAAGVSNSARSDLQIDFDDQPSLGYNPATFSETNLNNGAIGNSVGVTLTDDAFVAGPLTDPTHFSASGVPAGLGLQVVRDSGTVLTLSLTNAAGSHAAADNTSVVFLFESAAFVNVATGNIDNTSASLAVSFNDPPVLSYSRTTFSELSGGAIDNTTPLTITLSGGEAFENATFVEATHFNVTGLPSSLTAVVTRVSGTSLEMTLTGTADSHAGIDDATFTNTFTDAAFSVTQGDQVTGYQQAFTVDFNDSTLTINPVPYAESFESYSDGFQLAGTNGWQATFATAGIVTSRTDIVDALTNYTGSTFPIATTHDQVLCVSAEITGEIKSGDEQFVYTDVMILPARRSESPAVDTDHQFAFLVDTNGQLNILHRNKTGAPVDEWRALSASPVIPSNAWSRLTVEQDYENRLFRVRLDEGDPISDSAGFSAPGGSQPGPWFHMVNTNNAYLSRIGVQEANASYVEDLVVRLDEPFPFSVSATLYLLR